MTLEGGLHHVLISTSYHVVSGTVFLLVHRFQLTLKQSEDGIDHALGVQFAPLFQELRCKCVVVFRYVQ